MQRQTLPQPSWEIATLSSVASSVSASLKKVKTKDAKPHGVYPVIDQGATEQAGYLDDKTLAISASPTEPIILFGDHTRIIKYITRDFIPGADGTKLLRAHPGICPRYLQYLLRTVDIPDRGYGRHFQYLQAANLPIAPSEEQRRIADKLDTVLTRVDAVNDRLARVAPLLKRFRQSVLAAATSGRLTADWRRTGEDEDDGQSVIDADAKAKAQLLANTPSLAKKKSTTHCQINTDYIFDLPENWRFSTWGHISEWITYGFTRPMPSTSSGTRLLTAKDIHPFDIRIEGSGWTAQTAFSDLSDKDRPAAGDLLITKDGTIGRAALVRTQQPFCINQSVSVCWLRSTTMNKDFLEIVANADFTQRFVADMAKGMAIQHLSIVDFACCPVPVPSLSEQKEIVRRVELLLACADRLETRLQAARTAAQRLTPALLAKAFRGELVPQDPNDEPATELLHRLKENQSSPTAPAKQGRKPGKKAA